ncbi:MAG: hypothetical protein LBQ39_01965 [Tannerellaceae bacterium]|jgi:hypothetical protein|nr:hypothetical protein [Tannerellaceae bacterium]
MTQEQWDGLKKRIDAWLATELKEYKAGLNLLIDIYQHGSEIQAFEQGSPARYTGKLKQTLEKVAALAKYPRLITTIEQRDKLYIASVPVAPTGDELPGQPAGNKPIDPPVNPAEWDRYADWDTYKDRLSPELQKEGEQVKDWFLNQTSLHEQLKRLQEANADAETVAPVTKALLEQKAVIQEFYDRVEAYITGNGTEEGEDLSLDPNAKPSGKYSKAQIDRMKDPVFAALSKDLRIEADKKYLKREDVNNPEEKDLRRRELEEWGVVLKDQE